MWVPKESMAVSSLSYRRRDNKIGADSDQRSMRLKAYNINRSYIISLKLTEVEEAEAPIDENDGKVGWGRAELY